MGSLCHSDSDKHLHENRKVKSDCHNFFVEERPKKFDGDGVYSLLSCFRVKTFAFQNDKDRAVDLYTNNCL